ncbi:DNA internalization-related competence protein ComEC/Rec2 [Bacillus sp. FJAT-29790]|uniref:DNA internalization-related competence protein ComEC/Rec2 n=1 Tax=Bacillus sp. FJAT-29790 TaxID=1895002 RepID=UPI001C250CAA|nr:DNA internalization-related competence protein ComEC/Rec2 [Bacillus sp. FJAT-29790]MBU8879459.1 DNA internalization-related competence protein ComEC/Rec2 [Bacillus sp. FJAT-29790]
MKSRWIYFAVSALTGFLAAFINPFIFFAVYILMAILLSKRKNFTRKQILFFSLIFILFFVRGETVEKGNKSRLTGKETVFNLYFQEEIKVDGELLTARGKESDHREKLVIRYKIKTEKEKEAITENLKTGIACQVTGSLEEPASATNENAFNYKEYLKRNQMFWIVKIDHLNLSKCSPQKQTPLSFFRTIRQNGILYIQSYFPKKTAPLAVALLFGDRDLIEADVLKSYQKLGIVHLLAISGLHVGMLASMIYYFGLRIGVTREKMTTALLLFLPCYALLTGAAPSVIRAVFMMIIFLALKKWSRKFSLLTIDVISIVFVLYTFFSPLVIYEVGFQLSFSVSFSLVFSAPIILKRFSHPLSILFATSFICQLAATPIMFFYFFEVSVISILANAIFVPLFSLFILPVIFILFLLHLFFGATINLLLNPLNLLIIWMDYAAGRLSLIPFATLTLGRPSLSVFLLYLLIMPIFFSLWERFIQVKRFIQILFLPLIVMIIHALGNTLSPYGEITFIDVGQGDSILIKLPHGKGNYIIDTGGTLRFNTEEWKERQKQFEVGKDVVVPYLKSKGITTIHKLILTHGDMDHIGGSLEIIKELNVKELLLPKVKELSELEKTILNIAKGKKIPFHFTKAGERWISGDAFFQVLSPQMGMETERNNSSIVLFANIAGIKWLFTGDLEEAGEEKLISSYEKLKIDVLKVGHHGSKSSTSDPFLDQIKPRLAIISVGKNNRYGHPKREILEKLAVRHIKVLRTDQHGAISYVFKGDNGTFSVITHNID